MDEKLQQAYLYDFYGELLNDHQRRIYEDFYFNDLSLGEIAAQEEISRQAVADMVRRTGRKLAGYEEKLHLVEKFLKVKESAQEILNLVNHEASTREEMTGTDAALRIAHLAQSIMDEL